MKTFPLNIGQCSVVLGKSLNRGIANVSLCWREVLSNTSKSPNSP